MSSRRFGEVWRGPVGDVARGEGDNVDDAASSASSVDSATGKVIKHGTCQRQLPLVLAVVALFFFLVLIVASSGGEGYKGEPKALIFIFEGLKGTEFQRAVLDSNKAPHLHALISTGSNAECVSTADARCARTQSGANLDGGNTWSAAPGIASILTGVDANKHQVSDNSQTAMQRFANSSRQYPSFLRVLKDRGVQTAAFGTSRFLTSVSTSDGRCTDLGILDFECGVEAIGRCMRRDSCNLDLRVALQSTEEDRGLRFDYLADELMELLEEGEADAVVIHVNNLDVVASDPNDDRGAYSADSPSFAAQLYLADTVVGVATALLRTRAAHFKENWLVLGTADHGGLDKRSGTNPNDDEVVPFFASTITSFGALGLLAPQLPTYHMDVTPTVLRWFDLLGDGDNQISAAQFDGRVQAICGSGKAPRNCTDPTGAVAFSADDR